MRKSSIILASITASLLAGAALAQTPPAGGGMGGGRGAYTAEERAMMFLDQKGMTQEQIADIRAKQRDMSDADRTKQKADLDARWAKLSTQQQADAMSAMQASFQGRGGQGRPAQ